MRGKKRIVRKRKAFVKNCKEKKTKEKKSKRIKRKRAIAAM